MKRVLILSAAMLLLAASAAEAQQKVRWRMVTISTENSTYYTQFAKRFIDHVKALTDDQVEIQGVPSGVIAPPFQEYNAVMDGLAEAGNLPPIYIVNRDPTNALLGGHPGGMTTEQMLHWVYEGGGQQLWVQFRRETMGLHALVVGAGPTEVIHSIKPLRNAEDLKGLKFRTAGLWASILKDKFGGAPTTVPGAEIYSMLERKAIDAAEWSTPLENSVLGLQKAAKYVVVPGIHQPGFLFETVMKKETWDALPDKTKTRLEAAARLATFESLIGWGAKDLAALAEWRKAGNEVVQLDPAFVADVRVKSREWVMERAAEQKAKNNPWMERIAQSYYGFMDNWQQNGVYRHP